MITVVYACDDIYVRQTIISMVSLIQHNSNVKLYLVTAGLSYANQELLTSTIERYGCQIHFIDMEKVLPKIFFDEGDRHPKTVYAKLFFEDQITETRVLYLDSDVVVKGSLEPLFQRNMHREVVAGVLMPYSKKLKQHINVPAGQPYICDGIVLFNMELWRNTRKSEACSKYIQQCGGRPPMLSEGTLNYVCQGMIGILDPTYNLMPSMLMYTLKEIRQLFQADVYYQTKGVLEEARRNPVIVHFMNELYNRPWFEPCDHPYKSFYKEIEYDIFGNNEFEKKDIQTRTKVTRAFFRFLPFGLFSVLYHIRYGFKR